MLLSWINFHHHGVQAIQVPQIDSTEELIIQTERALIEQGICKRGDEVVILVGMPSKRCDNLMKIEIINEKWIKKYLL